jgi:hypothetical protein
MRRNYGFGYDKLPFDASGLLPRDKTPKQAWAELHLVEPIEVNRAPCAVLYFFCVRFGGASRGKTAPKMIGKYYAAEHPEESRRRQRLVEGRRKA